MTITIFYITSCAIALTGLLFVWECGLRPLMLDNFRDKVFVVRDRLYLLAQEQRIDCNSEAYRAVEQFLNGVIRYAHRFSLSSFLLTTRAYREGSLGAEASSSTALLQKIGAVQDVAVRNELNALVTDITYLLPRYIALSSLPFMICTAIYLMLRNSVPAVVKTKQAAVTTFKEEAFLSAKYERLATA